MVNGFEGVEMWSTVHQKREDKLTRLVARWSAINDSHHQQLHK